MPEKPEQQLEFLRRQDIRTMTKDMARIREEESKKERGRIFSIQEERKHKTNSKQQESLGHSPTDEPEKITLTPTGTEAITKELSRPPSRIKKIFVRVVVAFLLLFIATNAIALAYSLWKGRASKQQQTPASPTQEQKAPQKQASFPIPLQQTVSATSAQDVVQLFSKQHQQGLTRIVFAPGTQTAPELLASLGATIPEQIIPHIDSPSLLFLHALGEKNRLGIILVNKGDQKALQDAMSQWEPTMETSLTPFFRLMGDLGKQELDPAFKSVLRNGTTIRLQTISLNDFGIVYAISHNFLILTSSLESAEKIVDVLDNPGL